MNVWVVASFWDNLFTTNQESLNGSSIVSYVTILYKDSQELVVILTPDKFIYKLGYIQVLQHITKLQHV